MVTATKISLDVNVPLTGTVKFVSYYPEKPNPNKPGTTFSDQWALTGQWSWTTPEGEQASGEGKVYIDCYQLAASPLQLGLVQEDGTWDDGSTRYKWTHAGPIRLVKTEKDRKRHVTISRVQIGGGAVEITPKFATTAAPATPLTLGSANDTAGTDDPWASLERQYERARALACRIWGDDYEPQALVAAAATVFIEANRRGLMATFAKMPAALEHDE